MLLIAVFCTGFSWFKNKDFDNWHARWAGKNNCIIKVKIFVYCHSEKNSIKNYLGQVIWHYMTILKGSQT